jgi:hypothetical protein
MYIIDFDKIFIKNKLIVWLFTNKYAARYFIVEDIAYYFCFHP